MGITFISDYLWILAMLMTSPLIVTMGLSLTIPLALLGDFVFKGQLKNLVYWLGASLVLCGFSVVNLKRDEPHNYEITSTRESLSE
jgi:solute carrier family 35, member F5